MSEHAGPIYEISLRVARSAASALDDWVSDHVAEMLTQPGFRAAEVYAIEDDDEATGRVIRYLIDRDEDLKRYLAGPAAVMMSAARDGLGPDCRITDRVLRTRPSTADGTAETCLNCGAVITGQYCGQCGQRSHSRLISIFELLRDAFGDLVDVDSRLWRTLIPLAVRPGLLTRDYLRGRRARYMPPFRTYLVLSLLFFVIAFFDPREELGILFEPEAEPGPSAPAAQAEDERGREEAERAREEALAELESLGITPTEPEEEDDGVRISINGGEDGDNCDLSDYDPNEMPPWLARRLTKERLQVACERMTADDGQGLRGFVDKLLEYVPAGLFILLPLMALALNMVYPLSKRYYVEHLLFVVHYHAFVFLALTMQILLARLGALLSVPDGVLSAMLVAIPLYIPVYLFRGLRRVYEQGRIVTFLKFLFMLAAYILGLSLILGSVAIFAAFSV